MNRVQSYLLILCFHFIRSNFQSCIDIAEAGPIHSTTITNDQHAHNLLQAKIDELLKVHEKTIHANITRLDEQTQLRKTYHLVLAIRGRIAVLESFGDSKKKNINRRSKWLNNLRSKTPEMKVIWDRMQNVNLSLECFVQAVQLLYGDFNDLNAIDVLLPEIITEKDVENLLDFLKIRDEYRTLVKKVIPILTQPIEL